MFVCGSLMDYFQCIRLENDVFSWFTGSGVRVEAVGGDCVTDNGGVDCDADAYPSWPNQPKIKQKITTVNPLFINQTNQWRITILIPILTSNLHNT